MFNDSTGFTMPVAPVGYGSGNGMFGGDGWWAIIILLFLFGGFGRGFGGYGGYGESCATQSDVRSAIDQQTLISKIDQQTYGLADSFTALNNALNSNFRSVDSAICNLGYQTQQCCCETQRAIDSVNFNAAQNTCAITNAIHAEGEETRKLIQQNEIQSLRDKVADLQLAQSQCAQNAYLVNTLRPYPVQAVPFCGFNTGFGFNGFGFNNGCGCGCV